MSTKDNVEFDHLCFFCWDLKAEKQFKAFRRDTSVLDQIPEKWFTMTMKESGRNQKRTIHCLGKKEYSVFSKFQKGRKNIQ